MKGDDVLIGRPGDLIWPGVQIGPLTSHVGGQPCFPLECGLPDAALLKCGICEEQLRHILHISLPPLTDTPTTKHTSLYVYACTQDNCGKDVSSWRSLRCQFGKKESNTLTPAAAPTSSSTSTSAQRSAANPSRTITTGGWGFEESTDVSNSQTRFDFSDLEAALDVMSSKTPPPPPLSSKSTSSQSAGRIEHKNDGAVDKGVVDATVPSLPGFYLDMSTRESSRTSISSSHRNNRGDHSSSSSSSAAVVDEAAHIKDLLERYGSIENSANMKGAAQTSNSTRTAAATSVERGNRDSDDDDDDTDDASSGGGDDPVTTWEGEGYEKDQVLVLGGRKRADYEFLKFMKKLQNVPDQCVRQGREMAPLWPKSDDDLPSAPPCERCGACRVLEVQLMAPMIAALEESVDWLEEADASSEAEVQRPPGSWEWASVAVFVCKDRCCSGTDGVKSAESDLGEERSVPYHVEHVVVAREE